MGGAIERLEGVTTRRQLLRGTRAMLAVAAVSVLVCGWNLQRDLSARRGPRARARKWKWGTLALLWLGLAWWSEHRDDQRSSSST